MSESVKVAKKTKKTERSFLYCGSTPFAESNSGRLTLTSNRRLTKLMSNSSLEKLSFVSENDSCSKVETENFDIEYSTYLLRNLQKKLLTEDRENKEDNIKKSFVFYKFEMESLFKKYEETMKDLAHTQMLLEIIEQTIHSIEIGENVLKMLKDKDFEKLLNSTSNCLDQSLRQLHLIGIDKSVFEEAFKNRVLGTGSEIDECLKTINSCTKDSREDISKLATQLLEVEKLQLENSKLQERFSSTFEMISNLILETNYKKYSAAVKQAFTMTEPGQVPKTEHCLGQAEEPYADEDLLEGRDTCRSELNTQLDSLYISELDGSCPIRPNLESTPQLV